MEILKNKNEIKTENTDVLIYESVRLFCVSLSVPPLLVVCLSLSLKILKKIFF